MMYLTNSSCVLFRVAKLPSRTTFTYKKNELLLSAKSNAVEHILLLPSLNKKIMEIILQRMWLTTE